MLSIAGEPAGYETRSGRYSQCQRLERPFQCAVRRRAGGKATIACRRYLPRCQAVHAVVMYDIGDIHIPPTGVNEVPHSLAETIAVPTFRDNHQVVIPQLYSRSHRKRPAVQPVESIGVYPMRNLARTADPRRHDYLVRLKLQRCQSFFNRRLNTEVTATGAPVGLAGVSNFAVSAILYPLKRKNQPVKSAIEFPPTPLRQFVHDPLPAVILEQLLADLYTGVLGDDITKLGGSVVFPPGSRAWLFSKPGKPARPETESCK